MEAFWNTVVTYVTTNGLELLKNILIATAIFIIGRWVAKMVTSLVSKGMTKANVEATLHKFVKNLTYTALLVFVVIAALSKLIGKDSSGQFVAVVGAAGLAIGFALQGSLSNFAAGVLLIIFKPYKVGDFVEIAGTAGAVKEIQIFTTILHSPDNVKIIIPNAQATGGNIKNYTATGTRRVDLVMGVSYADDLKKAKQIIEQVIAADSRILADPATTVAVSELADSSVNFVVRPWVNVSDYWAVYFDLTEKIKVALEDGGCSIPFPQRDVHLFQEKTA